MKHFYLLFLMLTVCLNCSLVKPEVIPDKNLANAVRAELGLDPNEPILEKDLRALKQLGAVYKGIKNLTGLEKATNLRMLVLEGNEITNVTPLANLTQLTWLALKRNKISDITPLANLTQLTHLGLSSNESSDITPLTGLKQLT